MAIANGVPVNGLTSGLEGTITDYIGPFTKPVQVGEANPNRVYMLVLFSTATGIISPSPGSTSLGWGPDVAGQPGGRLLHRASLPGLLQGEWYGYDSGGGTIRVYDLQIDLITPPPG